MVHLFRMWRLLSNLFTLIIHVSSTHLTRYSVIYWLIYWRRC
jgi:hypothetical protein